MPAFLRWLLDSNEEYIKASRLPYEEATQADIDAVIAAGDADPDEADDDDDEE